MSIDSSQNDAPEVNDQQDQESSSENSELEDRIVKM